jgi:LacI family transcriptional regulator
VVLGGSTDAVAATITRCGFSELQTADAAIARLAAAHLLERGFRHFAFAGFSGCPWSRARAQTFAQTLREHGFRCVRRNATTTAAGRVWEQRPAQLAAWLTSLPRPVGIMACNDVCGCAVLQACRLAGLRVPEEVAVVGVDNDELLCETAATPLSSVTFDLVKTGYEAAALLARLMRSPARHRRQVIPVRPLHVVVRRSTDVLAQNDPTVALALRFIRDHAGQNIGVPDVVATTATARRTLERRFSEHLGNSVHAEIVRCRLERAKRLLLETSLPRHRVAAEAGFGEPRAMNRAFRQYADRLPRDYRTTGPAA